MLAQVFHMRLGLRRVLRASMRASPGADSMSCGGSASTARRPIPPTGLRLKAWGLASAAQLEGCWRQNRPQAGTPSTALPWQPCCKWILLLLRIPYQQCCRTMFATVDEFSYYLGYIINSAAKQCCGNGNCSQASYQFTQAAYQAEPCFLVNQTIIAHFTSFLPHYCLVYLYVTWLLQTTSVVTCLVPVMAVILFLFLRIIISVITSLLL